jgi:hypothetical protein
MFCTWLRVKELARANPSWVRPPSFRNFWIVTPTASVQASCKSTRVPRKAVESPDTAP